MLLVVETFSGIGSQAKALKNIGVEHKIVATVEWDINAIYAYDIIHNGPQDLTKYKEKDKNQLMDMLLGYTISNDGKKPLDRLTLKGMSKDALGKFLTAIERTNNLVSITDVKATDLPNNIDLLTYSFPCQDLSICGAWHGNASGINRNAHNRSGMLWEVERILKEYVDSSKRLPRFLLMENVSNILSEAHKHNFKEWENYLESIGYTNKIYTLDASNFGIPQKRKRTFMLSVYTKDANKVKHIKNFFDENDLEVLQNTKPNVLKSLINFLRTDYTNAQYRAEADISNPNYTPSRIRIHEENPEIFDGHQATCEAINTITTKQDRNPNSGLLYYNSGIVGKAPYRNLTPRECFLLMGFDESDFQALVDNDFYIKRNHNFLTRDKLIKMAGNSIVVDVLEAIFKQVIYIKENILNQTSNYNARENNNNNISYYNDEYGTLSQLFNNTRRTLKKISNS